MKKKSPEIQEPEKSTPVPKPEKKKRRVVKKAVTITGDVISGSIGAVLKVIGTILLIFLVAGMMFTCVFAYYVKTCLCPAST